MAITFSKSKDFVAGEAQLKVNPYDEHLVSKAVVGKTSVIKKSGKSEVPVKEVQETVSPGVVIPASQLMVITVEGSHTVNLGNYESAKIGVSLQVPTTKEGLGESYDWATAWIGERIEQAVKEAKGEA